MEREASPFLRLPPRLRHRIYEEVGATFEGYLVDLTRPGADTGYWDDRETNEFVIIYGLLLTCRKINEELTPIIYGNASFAIRFDKHNNLAALRHLRPSSLQALRDLTIWLNTSDCDLGTWFWEYTGYQGAGRHFPFHPPLSLSGPGKKVLAEWYSTWNECILPYLEDPLRLKIHLICDVDDVETGTAVVQPFLDLKQPMFAGCSIRLSSTVNANLTSLAVRAVRAATIDKRYSSEVKGEDANPRTGWTDLPQEIRDKILSYTDLIAPSPDIEWNSAKGMYIRDNRIFGCDGRHYQPGHVHLGAPLTFQGLFPDSNCWEASGPNGCYCRVAHSAYSSVHSCNCWAPPTPLFLVSHAMRRDAMKTFFSRNRFSILPEGAQPWVPMSKSPDRLPISIFLSTVVPKEALQYLRYLEIVYPAFGNEEPCAYCPKHSPELNDWIQTLDDLKDLFDPPKLTIHVFFASILTPTASAYRRNMTAQQQRDVLWSYVGPIVPLRRLQGLGRCFVSLADPAEAMKGWKQEWSKERMTKWEGTFERKVMRDDNYDAYKAGKGMSARSNWAATDFSFRVSYGCSSRRISEFHHR